MSIAAVRRPNALSLVLDLTRRLAEDYPSAPLPVVSRCVQRAASAVRLFGEDLKSGMDVVERIAREDLTVITTELNAAARNAALAG